MWAMTTANANVQDAGTSSNTAPHHPITGELQTLHCQVRLPVTTRESGHDPWVVYHLDYAWRLLWYAPHTNPHLSPHKPLCSPSLHLWVTLGFINIAMENGQFVDYFPWRKGQLTMAILDYQRVSRREKMLKQHSNPPTWSGGKATVGNHQPMKTAKWSAGGFNPCQKGSSSHLRVEALKHISNQPVELLSRHTQYHPVIPCQIPSGKLT